MELQDYFDPLAFLCHTRPGPEVVGFCNLRSKALARPGEELIFSETHVIGY
jgi:hypothetical protein